MRCTDHCPPATPAIPAAIGVVALAAVISSAAVLIADVLTAVLITMTALALAGLGVLAIVLRRHGLRASLPPGQPPCGPRSPGAHRLSQGRRWRSSRPGPSFPLPSWRRMIERR